MTFSSNYNDIIKQLLEINPIHYCKNRNFIDGDVTKLSPYVSRGIISTKTILNFTLNRGFNPRKIEKFIQELLWRDYWQINWKNQGFDQFKKEKKSNRITIPKSIYFAKTGVLAIDEAIKNLYKHGYIHNHLRMYIASITCNLGQANWTDAAKWMYANLKDADWGSNASSWLWVTGLNSNKKYYANQQNINKYCYTNQNNTFLDKDYPSLISLKEIPEILKEKHEIDYQTMLPSTDFTPASTKATFIYNIYNLDPKWKKGEEGNHVLLLEPSHFKEYPITQKNLNFILELSKNIESIRLFVGEFEGLIKKLRNKKEVYFKEHPFNNHYKGIEEKRDWIFDDNNTYSSFFKYWNKNKKQLL